MIPQKKDPQDEAKKSAPEDDAAITQMEEKIRLLTETAARAQADLQNAKIRMEKEAGDIRRFASESFLLKFLPTIDNFQRAFAHLPEDLKNHEWVKGVQAVEQDFIRQLGDVGLKKIDALGKDIDPSRHEVLVEGGGEKGKVVDVIEDGYELHGKVLRPAKVMVGKGA